MSGHSQPTVPDETARVRRLMDKTAPRYDRQMGFWEKVLFGGTSGRQWVCSQAEGDVLEIAIGTGRNLAYYPNNIRLTGVELSEEMLQIARRRAEELGREADLLEGDAQSLEFPDERFDTVVSTFTLCTIPDDRRERSKASNCASVEKNVSRTSPSQCDFMPPIRTRNAQNPDGRSIQSAAWRLIRGEAPAR